MLLETDRLIIRDLKSEDEMSFVEMASDGSLNDVGFNSNCKGNISLLHGAVNEALTR